MPGSAPMDYGHDQDRLGGLYGVEPRREERKSGSLEHFGAMLMTRYPARSKTLAPGFSATRYAAHYVVPATESHGKFTVDAPAVWRCAEGGEAKTAAELDLDGYTPDWEQLERTGNQVYAFTTWSHLLGEDRAPHWRLVIPFAEPIGVECSPSAFEAALERFE